MNEELLNELACQKDILNCIQSAVVSGEVGEDVTGNALYGLFTFMDNTYNRIEKLYRSNIRS